MKLYILAHKGSGSNMGERVLYKLINACANKNIEYHVFISKYKGHTIDLVKEIDNKMGKDPLSRLVIIGGDGTLHEAITGLREYDSSRPISFLPAGTGNHFNRSVPVETNPDKLINSLLSCFEPKDLEIIRYRNIKDNSIGYAVNSFGFGFDSLIIHLSTKKSTKLLLNKLGLSKLSYLHHLISAIKLHKKYSISILENGNQHEYDKVILACVTNHPYLGSGIKLDPIIKQNDHKIGFIIAHSVNFWSFLKVLTKLIKNSSHLECTQHIARLSSNRFEIILKNPQYMQVDGEDNPEDTYHIECELDRHSFWFTKHI